MEIPWFGIGVLLVLIGPLFNVPIVWLIRRTLFLGPLAKRWPRLGSRRASWIGAIALWCAVLFVSWLPGWRLHRELCDALGTPRIAERAPSEGFFRTKMFPYEVYDYLDRDRFAYVEAPDPYEPGRLLRYTLHDGVAEPAPVEALASTWAVERAVESRGWTVDVSIRRIFRRESGRELARAASISYRGGPLGLLMGTSSGRSCPDLLSEEGSRDFDLFYRLEAHVLGPASPNETASGAE